MSSNSQASFAESVAKFIRDLLRMGDLQLQLLSIDLKAVGQSARFATALGLAGLGLLAGSVPVLMFGVAGVLHLLSLIPVEYAWLLVGGMGCTLGMIVLGNAVNRLTQVSLAMKRSQDEFHKNLEWVRGVLHQQ